MSQLSGPAEPGKVFLGSDGELTLPFPSTGIGFSVSARQSESLVSADS